MKDIIIVGAGPSGMTAAIYALRGGKSVMLIDPKGYGGQIINASSIVNYPAIKEISGVDYATSLYEQVSSFGGEFVFDKVKDIIDGDIKKVICDNDEYECRSIIIATGATNRPLGIENEENFIGKGISYCATCDGNFYKDKDVCVVGGGDTALTDAIYLSNICNKVYLIHRRDEFRGSSSYVDKIKDISNIELVLNSNVTKLIGDDKINGVEVTDKDDNIRTISVDGVFVAIGQMPENGNFKKYVDIDDKGYIISDENCHTKTEGIFVCGDTRTKTLRQLTTAINDGSIAGTEACDYLNK